MADAKKGRARKSGLPPRTPMHIGERRVEEVLIKGHQFTEHQLEQFLVKGALES